MIWSYVNEKLTESVKKRLMSDVPFGVLLSGGLDSSIITCLAKQKNSWTVRDGISRTPVE